MAKTKRMALRRLHIPITPEVINNAVQRDSSHCVIADAIRAALPDVTRVTVDLQTIRFTLPNGERVVFLTPAPEQGLLVGFDQGVKPQPRDMYLSHPIQVIPPRKPGEPRAKAEAKVVSNGEGKRDRRESVTITVEGGRLPPTAALSNTRGRRRTFGIRSLRP